MTKTRWPVKVETRRNRSRKREPRTPAQPMGDRTMFKGAPVGQTDDPATHAAPAAKIAPAKLPMNPGATADDCARILQNDRFPKWLWSPVSA